MTAGSPTRPSLPTGSRASVTCRPLRSSSSTADLPSADAGETPIIAPAPAIANAISAASGVRIRSLPLVPDGAVPAGTWAPPSA